MSETNSIGDNAQIINESTTVSKNNCNMKVFNNNWKKRKHQLLHKIAECETSLIHQQQRSALLAEELEVRTKERITFTKRIAQLKDQLTHHPDKDADGYQNVDSNNVLVVTETNSDTSIDPEFHKNQALQIEALTQQVKSLKEVISITENLLELKTSHENELEQKLKKMESQFAAENRRHTLMHSKLDNMMELNSELKNEYEKQIQLFSGLHKIYSMQQDMAKDSNS